MELEGWKRVNDTVFAVLLWMVTPVVFFGLVAFGPDVITGAVVSIVYCLTVIGGSRTVDILLDELIEARGRRVQADVEHEWRHGGEDWS